ncbi:hypothetical protein G7046_g2982 [Stylonectria norvegica]|nr:hypothetical protein G7046_g2982 [Stylonectria norvegica]
MASLAKTIVATGLSSGLGFEALKQLLEQAQPYKLILGVRNTQSTLAACDGVKYDKEANSVTALPLELSDLKDVKSFAEKTLAKLGQSKIDYLLLNAGMSKGAEGPGPHGSKWCEAYVVNHLSQHYLVHLLREKLVESESRIVFVSSGAVRSVPDIRTIEKDLTAGSDTAWFTTYCESKFVQLLGAHWWRRELAASNRVVAVSPGLIPGTGLGRHVGMKIGTDMPDAKSVPEGAQSILAALTRSDFPKEPERIFLTSWGEWWEKSEIEKSLDEKLWDKWSPSKQQIEKDEGIAA